MVLQIKWANKWKMMIGQRITPDRIKTSGIIYFSAPKKHILPHLSQTLL